jgi:hypothetical protein
VCRSVANSGSRISTSTRARSKLFRALPELEWQKGFSVRAARAIGNRIEPARRRTLVSRALERLLEGRKANLSERRPRVRQWLAKE